MSVEQRKQSTDTRLLYENTGAAGAIYSLQQIANQSTTSEAERKNIIEIINRLRNLLSPNS